MKYTSFPVQQKKLHQNKIAPNLIQPTQVNIVNTALRCLLCSLRFISQQLGELRNRTHGCCGKVGELS